MQIPFSMLSAAPREEWLEVPARVNTRAHGMGRVKVRELSALEFDSLWTALVIAERKRLNAKDAADKAPLDPQAQYALTEAKQAEREAQDNIVAACVVGHDPKTFSCAIPPVTRHTAAEVEVRAVLSAVGYTTEEIESAITTGTAAKCFTSAKEAAHFYRRCQPDGGFLTTLLFMIYRFQQSELLSAAHFWKDLPPEPVAVAAKAETSPPKQEQPGAQA